jgi:hypothetical protein
MADDFYLPNRPPQPPRQPKAVERLFEFSAVPMASCASCAATASTASRHSFWKNEESLYGRHCTDFRSARQGFRLPGEARRLGRATERSGFQLGSRMSTAPTDQHVRFCVHQATASKDSLTGCARVLANAAAPSDRR